MRTWLDPFSGRSIAAKTAVLAALLSPLMALPAHALLQGFPTNDGMVAVAVGGAFALPAMVAGLFACLRRVGEFLGPLLAATVIVLMGLMVVAYVRPELINLGHV